MKTLATRFRTVFLSGMAAIVVLGTFVPWQPYWYLDDHANAQALREATDGSATNSVVTVAPSEYGLFRYFVNGIPQSFVGMGYNPIYRDLADDERAANYDRDFQILCEAGVNHIIGWDADKGYEQDKFDEITLDHLAKYGLGVVMPFNLPPDGNYEEPEFRQSLLDAAEAKVERFKNHPALRMWGVGNEVLVEMESTAMYEPFLKFYVQLADLFHQLDSNHPVIYREAEDVFVPLILSAWKSDGEARPWLLYGTNSYTPELRNILDRWPAYESGLPLFVSEFGAPPDRDGGRAAGYAEMWAMIREFPDYVIGGAPYAWTTAGPEPTDLIWGLMDGDSRPVDDAFEGLAAQWRSELSVPVCQL